MSCLGVGQHPIADEKGGTMDYNSIVQAIGSVGFPIVACIGLFWMINTTMKEFTASIDRLNESILTLTTKIAGGEE